MAIIDTGFFSSLYKIGRVKLLYDNIPNKIIAPSTVYDEISQSHFYSEALKHFTFGDKTDKRRIIVRDVDISESKEYFQNDAILKFGRGEVGCFMLAKQTNEIILTDDAQARRFAAENNIKAMSLPSFLVSCKSRKTLSVDEIKKIISDLKIKDYYGIKKEILDELLRK